MKFINGTGFYLQSLLTKESACSSPVSQAPPSTETSSQEVKSPVNTVEAEEKKPDDMEVKEEPMETENKGMAVVPEYVSYSTGE